MVDNPEMTDFDQRVHSEIDSNCGSGYLEGLQGSVLHSASVSLSSKQCSFLLWGGSVRCNFRGLKKILLQPEFSE
jgi:hypothetical protein